MIKENNHDFIQVEAGGATFETSWSHQKCRKCGVSFIHQYHKEGFEKAQYRQGIKKRCEGGRVFATTTRKMKAITKVNNRQFRAYCNDISWCSCIRCGVWYKKLYSTTAGGYCPRCKKQVREWMKAEKIFIEGL